MKHIHTTYGIALSFLLLLACPSLRAQDSAESKLPSGKLVETDDGAVLTLPSGEKFVSKTVRDTDNWEDVLIFPNGQKFASETAKGGGHVPFVSTDGALVAIVRAPATKTLELHIYFREANGQFKEIQNANEQVAKLLTEVKVNWPNYDPPSEAAKSAVALQSMSGHTLSLESVSYWGGHESKIYPFKVTVATDGSLSLAK